MRPLTIVINETGSRGVVEEALDEHAKTWLFKLASAGTRGQQTLRYEVRLRKKLPEDRFIERIREAGGGGILSVTLGPEANA